MLKIFTVTYRDKDEEAFYWDDPSLACKEKEKRAIAARNRKHGNGFGGKNRYKCRCCNYKELSDKTKLDTIEMEDLEKGFDQGRRWKAVDFVFSAPESVSRQIHAEKDLKLFGAHVESVQECVKVIKGKYAAISEMSNGLQELVNTGDIVAALMPHQKSRFGHAHIHTHAVIFNTTEIADGSRHALCHQRLLEAISVGKLYRQKLLAKVQALGYQTYETSDGFGI